MNLSRCLTYIAVPLAIGCGSSNPAGSGAEPSASGAAGMASSNGTAGVANSAGSSSAGAATAGASADGSAGAVGSGGVSSGGNASAGSPSTGSGGLGGSGGQAGAAGRAGGGSSGGSGGSGPLPAVSVYIAGDSTVSDYVLDPNDPKSWAGWGQMLAPNYSAKVTIHNAAIGGRTARRFIQEGRLTTILNTIQPNDYLLVQFGTNDSNPTATYVLDNVTYPYFANAETDFKTYLQQYIDGATAKHAIVALVTPPPRNSAYCGGGRSLANYGQAMIELGQTDNVRVLNLGLKTYSYLNVICPKPVTTAQENFFKVLPDGTIDGTHFQENGARVMAGFVADAVDENMLGLSAYRVK